MSEATIKNHAAFIWSVADLDYVINEKAATVKHVLPRGVPGYERLLAALANPTDPEHDELIQWAPDGFDPEAFDLVAANRRLRGR